MNMFNDLTNNKDVVLKNDNVLRLLGKNIPYNENKELPIYPVVNADESQIQAIKAATNGKSFVLQGPPGSGKSQTITNIIFRFTCWWCVTCNNCSYVRNTILCP